MYTNKEISQVLGLGEQNTKKLVISLDMEYNDRYNRLQLDHLKEHCYKFQRTNGNRTITSFAKFAGISRQRVHKKALQMHIICKSSNKAIILSVNQVQQLKEIFHV